MQIVGGDLKAELSPGIGIERLSVGIHTWLVEAVADVTEICDTQHELQKTPEKQVTHRTP